MDIGHSKDFSLLLSLPSPPLLLLLLYYNYYYYLSAACFSCLPDTSLWCNHLFFFGVTSASSLNQTNRQTDKHLQSRLLLLPYSSSC